MKKKYDHKLSALIIPVLICFTHIAQSDTLYIAKQSDKCITKTINKNWTFNYFPQENLTTQCQQKDFDDSLWPVIALPHTWSTYETTGDIHPFIKYPSERDNTYWWYGLGWYRKHFIIPKKWFGSKIFVEFDGVQKHCRLWLNGKYIGEHKGGYNSFYFDLTDQILFNKDNVLVLSVSNRRDDPERIPPMIAGNWNLYGGIYRDVRLVIKDRLYSPFQGSYKHEGGVFITTSQISKEQAAVQIQTYVKNEYHQSKNCTVTSMIIDSDNKVIKQVESTKTIASGELICFKETGIVVDQPKLWSPETPHLYQVVSEIRNGDQLIDVIKNPLGFRWFYWDNIINRLILNGEPVHIHGTNRHQEYPWLGDAIPKWLILEDMKDIHFNLNHNFLRGAHYTQDKLVYDFCDKHGIIVCEEVPNIKSIDFSEEIQEQNIREMIRRDRNHPSILFWSMGNETNDAADSRWAWEEDTTRIIHARHVRDSLSAGEYVTHTHRQMDMENLLRCTIRGWYNRDVKNLEPVHHQHTGHEEWQHIHARLQGKSARGRIDMGNGVMWLYADHGADREYKNAPLKHVNPKGWVDVYRFPKYLYYLWQANYAEKAMAFIHPHYWQRQYLNQRKNIVVDSNCEWVELLVNEHSYGILYPDSDNFYTVTFENVKIESGRISVKGQKNGETTEYKLIMAGEEKKLIVKALHEKIPASLNSMTLITADIVDKNNLHAYGANPTLEWFVSGPATLVGPQIYTSDRDKHEEMEGTMYIDTPVRNIIRSTGEPGKITIQVKTEGLETGEIQVIAVSVKDDKVSGIIEPELDKQDRKPIARPTYNLIGIKKVREEVKSTVNDLYFQAESDQEYIHFITEILLKQNPNLENTTIEFEMLIKRFTSIIQNNSGRLIADDYNIIAGQYNRCREITRSIRNMGFDIEIKQKLISDYSYKMILNGTELDIGREMQKIITRP
jgi:hypothetical protein